MKLMKVLIFVLMINQVLGMERRRPKEPKWINVPSGKPTLQVDTAEHPPIKLSEINLINDSCPISYKQFEHGDIVLNSKIGNNYYEAKAILKCLSTDARDPITRINIDTTKIKEHYKYYKVVEDKRYNQALSAYKKALLAYKRTMRQDQPHTKKIAKDYIFTKLKSPTKKANQIATAIFGWEWFKNWKLDNQYVKTDKMAPKEKKDKMAPRDEDEDEIILVFTYGTYQRGLFLTDVGHQLNHALKMSEVNYQITKVEVHVNDPHVPLRKDEKLRIHFQQSN